MTMVIDGTNGLTFNNGSTQSSAPGMTLLATITPTAATTIQSLNCFTSAYDTYYITYNNIQTSSNTGTCTLDMRFAVAGAVVSTSNYNNANAATTTYINLQFGLGTLDAAYASCAGAFIVTNANSTGTYAIKSISGTCVLPSTSIALATNGYGAFWNSAPITGFSMYLRNGVNFAAQGSVRVYGYANS